MKLKIALFTDSYLPLVNGVAVAVKSLAEELRALGHEVHLVAPTFHGHHDIDPFVFRYPSIQPPVVAYRFPFAVPLTVTLGRKFTSLKFDIVHTHTPFMVGLAGRNFARDHDIPVVSTYHTLYEEYVHYVPVMPKMWLKTWLASYLRYYYSSCDGLITPSLTALRSLQSYGITRDAQIIPTGMPKPIDRNSKKEREALGIHENERLLLYVGRIAQEKNIPMLLRAMKIVFAQMPQTRLALVGDGPLRSEAEEIVEMLGIEGSVDFVGSISREQVSRYYSAADLFVFPSQTETQGLVIGEAQTYGLACVAVEGGGASEALTNDVNGLIVPPKEERFAAAILELLSDDMLREKFGASAAERWQDWSPNDTANKVLKVYQEAIENHMSEAEALKN